MLDKSALKPWTWYRGEGRIANIALWDGHHFHTIGEKFNYAVQKVEDYWTPESGSFKPLEEISWASRD